MKKIYLLLTLFAWAATGFAQDAAVCHTTSTEKFAMFASNKDFNAEHPKPRAYVHITQEGGKMITFKTPDGQEANGYLIEAKKKTNNWVLVFQEWWGLNDNIKRQAENLYKDLGNVNVLALDMYDGKVTDDRTQAGKFMQEFKQERGDAIVKGALTYVSPKAKIATIGWCFGGGQSLLAALNAGKQAAACVIYYGMPVDDVSKLEKLNTDVLGIFASRDKYINADVVKKFEANMKAAGKKATVKTYDADHGFANPSNPIYDKAATEDAYKLTVAYLKERLK
jgi:carboxymethylenebutenolidase